MNRKVPVTAGPPQTAKVTTSYAVVDDTDIDVARERIVKLNDVEISHLLISGDGYRSKNIDRQARTTLQEFTVPANGTWTSTTTFPDDTQWVDYFTNARLVASTHWFSNATPDAAAPANIQSVSGTRLITGTAYDYDDFGRLDLQIDARTGQSTYGGYLENGSVTSVTLSGNRTTTYSYDKVGQIIAIDAPDTEDETGALLENITKYSYHPTGNLRAVWHHQTYPRFYEYDAQQRMIKLHTWQDEPTLTHSTASPPAGSAVTEWQYDSARGWLTEKNYHGESGNGPGGAADYTYTAAGRLQTRTWERGVSTTYGYNEGYLTSVNYSDNTPHYTYSYTPEGQLDLVKQGVDTHADYDYDATNFLLMTEKLQQNVPGAAATLHRHYDDLLRPLSLEIPSQYRTAYGYDTAGRLNRVWDQPTLNANHQPIGASDFTYAYLQKSGRLIRTVDGPIHTVTNNWYADRNILLSKVNGPDGQFPASIHNYGPVTGVFNTPGVNALGQRLSHISFGSAYSDADGGGFVRRLYHYNKRGELATADYDIYQRDPQTNELAWIDLKDFNYQFDAIGNRRTSTEDGQITNYFATNTGGTGNQGANPKNQYQSIQLPGDPTPTVRTHDEDGNLTRGKLPVDLTQDHLLTWDAENRLTEIRDAATNALIAEYHYDYRSRRISKHTPSEDLQYTYDGWNLLTEKSVTNGTGTLKQSFTWGLDLTITLQGAGGVGGLLTVHQHGIDPSNQSPITNHYYPTYDGNGNVSEYLNNAGNWVAHYDYDSFGNTITSTGPQADQFLHRFSTKPIDTETGLYYYGYRYYDPVTGRWPSRDPIEEFGGHNIYGFVGNNAIHRVDLLGLSPREGTNSRIEGRNRARRRAEQNRRRNARKPDGHGGFHHYGNWGGPGWANGEWRYETDPLPDPSDPNYNPPIDARDACYEQHDRCISACPPEPKKKRKKCKDRKSRREANKRRNRQRNAHSDCVEKCDHELAQCLRNTGNRGPESFAFDTIIPWLVH